MPMSKSKLQKALRGIKSKPWKSSKQRDLEKKQRELGQTAKNFYQHRDTGEIYAIERYWSGGIVGSAGPLPEDDLKDLDSYDYTPERNDWLKDASDKLTLLVPLTPREKRQKLPMRKRKSWKQRDEEKRQKALEEKENQSRKAGGKND